MSPEREKNNVPVKDSVLDKDTQDLHRAVSELLRIYQFRDRKSICYYDISVTQCYAMSSVIKYGPVALNELAALLYLDKSTVSRVAGALVSKGYLRRSVDPDDARALKLEVTRKGLELHSKIVQDLVEEMKHLVAEYDHDTRKAMTRLIERLTRAASERFRRKGQRNTGNV